MTLDLELTEYDKLIYNTHLRVARTAKNQPFKYRKDFDGVDDRVKFLLKKISMFLRKFPHIDINEFIQAPYKLYPDETHFDLEFYTTLKATKAYTLYQSKKMFLDPDSQEQLENIKSCLIFISTFCKDNDIKVEDYINHRQNNQFSFLLHLKEHRVNVYCLLGFESFDQNLKSVDNDLLSFIIGDDLINHLPVFRTKYFNSSKARKFVDLGIQKIKQK